MWQMVLQHAQRIAIVQGESLSAYVLLALHNAINSSFMYTVTNESLRVSCSIDCILQHI